jgi:hypothetical protein
MKEISNPQEKLTALKTAIDCINYVNSVRPDTITEETLAYLAELKTDLLCMNNTN